MLGKLIKHEWKEVSKLGGIILATIALVTLFGSIILQSPLMTNLFRDTTRMSGDGFWAFTRIMMVSMSAFIYIMMLMAAVYGIIIYMGVHFYQKMYTDEGYLTHTLPVSAHELLISKVLVSGIWVLLVYAVTFLSVMALTGSVVNCVTIAEGTMTVQEVWRDVAEGFAILLSELGAHDVMWAVSLILLLLTTPFTAIMILFGSLTLGQLSRKHKLLAGILIYIGVTVANSILSSLIQMVVMTVQIHFIDSYTDSMVNPVNYVVNILFLLAVGVGAYFLSHFVISKKLNME